jgi:hypothetical protein
VALWAFAGDAAAQVACNSLPNPVYLTLGATQEPLLKEIGFRLRNASNAAAQVTVVYLRQGSCNNIAGIYAQPTTPVTVNMQYIPSAAENPSWTPSAASPTCTVPGGGITPDIANSNAFVSACVDESAQPANVQQFRAAIQAYGFIVPKASTERAITAEEGYFVFGFGANGQAAPWTDENSSYILPNDRGVLISTMAAVKVPRERARGQRLLPNEVISSVAQSPAPQKTIGLAGVELADLHRDKLKMLAFRAFGQRYAYFPDTTATSFDKENVRSGLYFPWSPTIYITKVDPTTKAVVSGDPADTARAARAKFLIDLLQGNGTAVDPGFEPLDQVVKAGLVPVCAMKVTRSAEAGDLTPFDPPEPCNCFYEKKYPNTYTSTSCTACTSDSACGAGKCRHGFCEAK